MKKNNSIWEVLLRIVIEAATAALTALGTTACMGVLWTAFAYRLTLRWMNSSM